MTSSQVYLTSPIIGGFGNQMFIIASAFNLKNLFPDVKLVLLNNEGTKKRPSYWNDFFSDCPRIQEVLVSSLPNATWEVCGGYDASDEFSDISAIIEQKRQKGISSCYRGYFQNWRYLPTKALVNEWFNIPHKQSRVKEMITDFDPDTTCSLHFRLGDYKQLSHIHPILPDLYYQNAIRAILYRNPNIKTLLVFNELEDQKTVRTRMNLISPEFDCEVRYATDLCLKEWEEVILMSLCGANVVANSSFSWWAAFFNCHVDLVIIYPPKWWNGESQPPERALALPGWIKRSTHVVQGGASELPLSSSPSICIDVGSHDGGDSLRLHGIYSTKVYAFEPHPKFFNVTVKNTKHNTDIEVLPYAVSDSTSTFITLNESQGDQSHSILPFKSTEELNIAWAGCYAVHPSGRSFVVRLTRLDSFLDSRGYSPSSLVISHLHVDAQGADLEVLRSLGLYLPCIKTGVVEAAKTAATSSYQGQQGTIASVTEFLQENGFIVDAVRPNDVTPEISREFNICFSRK